MPDDGPLAYVAGGVVRLGMACVLAQSGWHAVRDFGVHTERVRAYRLLPDGLVPACAFLVAAGNFAVALALLPAMTARVAAQAGCVLMLVYAVAIRINVWRGRVDIDCGCGGGAGQKISSLLASRNLVLAGLLARASLCPVRGAVDAMSVVAMWGGAASFAAMYFATSQLLANHAALAGTRA